MFLKVSEYVLGSDKLPHVFVWCTGVSAYWNMISLLNLNICSLALRIMKNEALRNHGRIRTTGETEDSEEEVHQHAAGRLSTAHTMVWFAFSPPEPTPVQDHDMESNYKEEIWSCLLIMKSGKAIRITPSFNSAIQLFFFFFFTAVLTKAILYTRNHQLLVKYNRFLMKPEACFFPHFVRNTPRGMTCVNIFSSNLLRSLFTFTCFQLYTCFNYLLELFSIVERIAQVYLRLQICFRSLQVRHVINILTFLC